MEQGQPSPDPRTTPGAGGQPPPDQGTTPPASGASEATTEAQASPPRDERQPADSQGEAASPTPPSVSWSGLDPDTRRRLLDEADPEELRKHERVAGLSGQMAERLYRRRVGELRYEDLPEGTRADLVRRVQEDIKGRESAESERRLGQEGEFYTLGQKRWDELQQRQSDEFRQRSEREAEGRVLTGFQSSVQSWATENFEPEVIDSTAAKLREDAIREQWDKLDYKGQYQFWLKTLYDTAKETAATQARQKWEKEDLPTYRERWLAERNGGEPSPETDGGSAVGSRVLTDEIIRGMNLDEFKAVWDLKNDRPKEGYTYRSTNGINPREMQRAGRAQQPGGPPVQEGDMATGTGIAATGNEFVDKTIADGIFSPDIWSKKVLAATESNLVLANLFNRQYESDATVGKAVKIASIGNLAARAKTENAAILYETITETVTTLTLNIWDYAAIGVEDIVEVQSNINLRQQYENKIGYALAQDVDTKLATAAAGFTQTVGALGTPFSDDNVRRANQYLDDADVPEAGRFLVMTPAEKNDKLGLDRWSNQLYRGGTAGEQVTRGRIGNEVYGLDPYVTTNLVKPSAGQGNNIVAHPDSYALVMQREPKMHLFYDIDFFTWKVASEQIFGHGELRDTFGVWLKGAS